MRRIRTRLFLAAAACCVLSLPARAQILAPTLSGETGLFEIPTANSLQTGHFSFGLSWSMWNRTAAPVPGTVSLPDDPLRYDLQRFGGSIGFGLTDRWEMTLAAGAHRYEATDGFLWQGLINGHYRTGSFARSETDKVRLGTKFLLNPRDPVSVALILGYAFPTQSKNDVNALGTYKPDADFGLAFTYGWFTFSTKYLLTGKVGTTTSPGDSFTGYTQSNEWTNAIGLAIPIVPNFFTAIGELNRVHYDGGDTQPGNFSETLLGGRFAFGDFTASGAVRIAIDRWAHYGDSPGNFGGVIQVAWAPVIRPPAKTKIAVAEEPPPSTKPVPPPPSPAPVVAPAPAPGEPAVVTAPAARPATSTTDEILFDSAKSRLTNIAKAILDGVALRLKNNLAATCTVSAWTDAKEKGDHAALAKARAEAAKDYLMKRHGIDGSRIATEVKGDGDAADATRNRRAVVSVTFP